MYLLIEVLKPFGYFDEHDVGEIFEMPLKDVNELVRKGYIQIVVNNAGNNVPTMSQKKIHHFMIFKQTNRLGGIKC